MKKKNSIFYAFKIMGKGKLWLIISIIALLCAMTAAYISPLITGYAIDYCIGGIEPNLPGFIESFVNKLGGRDFFMKHFWILPLAVVVVTLIQGLFVYVRGTSMTRSAEVFSKNMRDTLYHHLQEVPYDYHKHVSTGDIIQRCTSDIQTIKRFISNQLIHIIRTIGMVFIASYIMFNLNVKLSIISIVLLPVLCIGGMLYFKYVRKFFKKVDVAEGKLSSVLQENVTGVRVVRAFSQQKSEFEKFTNANNDLKSKFNKFYTLMGIFWGCSDFVSYSQTLLTLAFGAIFAVKGEITLGQFLVFNSYSVMLVHPVRQLGRVLADLGKASVSMGRLAEILDAEPEKEPGKALDVDVKGDIVFSHVSFGYDTKDDVLSDISFEAKQGETIAILGSTGSGKSSLVQLMQRLYTVTEGSITIGGININDIKVSNLRKNVGIVLQEPYLYSRTVMENIRITNPKASDEDVYSVAKIACIHEGICGFENGYNTVVGEKGVTLSGGQKQRVAIARTLMQKTPIIIFDDSLSAVDTETDMEIRKALKANKGDATTFIISHRITTLCEADKIIVLDKGKIVQEGKHDDLIQQEGIYRDIALIQDMARPLTERSVG